MGLPSSTSKPQPQKRPALGYDDAVSSALGNVDISFYAERFVLDVGSASLGDADHAGIILEVRSSAIEVGTDRWICPVGETGIDGKHIVLRGLGEKQRFEIQQLLGILLRKIPCLAEVLGDVVELPRIVIRVGHHVVHLPRQSLRRCAGHPSILVEATIRRDLEILGRMSRGRLRVVEGVDHANARQRPLLCAVEDEGRLHADCLQNRRRDVDDVMELRPDLTLRLDPIRPAYGHPVSRSAEVRRNLFRPLKGRVHGVRPADRIVVIGLVAAQFVHNRQQERKRLRFRV